MTDWVDAWARLVAQRVSRRQLLGGMGAITAGSALGVLTPAAASAGARPSVRVDTRPLAARTCPSGYVPCGDICCDPDGTCITAPGGVQVCSNACAGNADLQMCSGVCQDVLYDPNNCGWCGNVCPPPPPNSEGKSTGSAVCNSGTCGCSCDNGLLDCIDKTGKCHCIKGSTCPCNTKNCPSPGKCCSGVCTYTSIDPTNCGTCGHVCECQGGFTPVCESGTCMCVCLPPNTQCSSSLCVNLSDNLDNCGACGNNCTSQCTPGPGFSTVCFAGQCENIEIIVQPC